MKRYLSIVIFSVLTSLSFESIAATPTVKVCIIVNGIANSPAKTAWLCANDTVKLSASNCISGPLPTSVSYRWRNIDVSPYTDTLKSSASATVAGRWVGYIKDNTTLIEYSDTVFLTNAPATSITAMSYSPAPPAAAGGRFCPLTVETASFTTSGSYVSYQWYDFVSGVDFLIPGATNSTYTFTHKPAVPTIIAKNIYGCYTRFPGSYADSASTIPVDLGPDLVACQGTNVTVQNKPGGSATVFTNNISYQYFLEGSAMSKCSSVTASPPATYNSCIIKMVNAGPKVKIWITVSHPFITCPNADTLNVNVTAIPVVNLGPDSIICYSQSMDINGIISGKAPYAYTWTSLPAGYTSSGSPNITVTPTATTSYILNVTDANNCGSGKDTVLLTENPRIFTSVSNDTIICMDPNATVPLKATSSGGKNPLTYLWSPSPASPGIGYGLSSTTILNPTATPVYTYPSNKHTGTRTYSFKATDINHCSNTSSVTITSYVPSINIAASTNGSPLANPIANPPIVNETTPITLSLTSASSPSIPFSLVWKNWIDLIDHDTIYNFGLAPSNYIKSLGTSPILNLEYNGPAVIFYGIVVHNTNSTSDPLAPNSCLYKDTIKVKYISDNTLLYVPNIFSPNAVDSTNQHLRIYGDNLASDGFKFVVYNKWGNLMYETADLEEVKTKGWDGGSQIEGVYTYVIIGKFKNGKDVKESPSNRGTFSLVR